VRTSLLRATAFGSPWCPQNGRFTTEEYADPYFSVGNNVTFGNTNMEGASHILLKPTAGALKTADAFDFYVEVRALLLCPPRRCCCCFYYD